MKKIAAAVACAVAFAGSLGVPAAAGEAGYENYIVRPGDTLSGVAERVLGDRTRWREIHRENPQVKKENLIFPGDTLRIPVPVPEVAEAAAPEAAAAEPEETAAQVEAEEEAPALEPEPELPVEVVRSIPVVNPGLMRAAGYIADALPLVGIVSSLDGRELLGPGDQAVANAALEPGAQLTVLRADRRVYHPLTGEPLGWLVRILGTAEATCPGATTSTVTFRSLRDAATVGDYLVPGVPAEEELLLPRRGMKECVAPGAVDAVIVAMDEDRATASEQEIVYIDRGTASGIGPGSRLQIFRTVAPAGTLVVGELLVLRAGPETATALVSSSRREVQVADLLRLE